MLPSWAKVGSAKLIILLVVPIFKAPVIATVPSDLKFPVTAPANCESTYCFVAAPRAREGLAFNIRFPVRVPPLKGSLVNT